MKLTIVKTLTISILLIMILSSVANSSNGLKNEFSRGVTSQMVNPFDVSSSPALDWNKTYVPFDCDYSALHPLSKTTDGGYAVAGTSIHYGQNSPVPISSEKFLVRKMDSTGNEQWAYTYDVKGVRAQANSIIQTIDGGYAILGYKANMSVSDYSTFSQGYYTENWSYVSICLLKIDSAGSLQWIQDYNNGPIDTTGYSIVQNDDNGYTIVGSTYSSNVNCVYLVRTDSAGVVQWSQTYTVGGAGSLGTDIVKSIDGGFVIAGYSKSSDTGAMQYLLLKTDNNGNEQWAKVFGGANSISTSLIQTSDFGYALIGYTNSTGGGKDDFYLVKTDGAGNQQWAYAYGGLQDDKGFSIVQTSDGYAIAGQTASYGTNATNGWLVKTDLNGNMQWSETFSGSNINDIYAVTKLNDGSYALAGDLVNGTTYSGGYPYNTQYFDRYRIWLVKVVSDGSTPAPIPTPTPTSTPTPPHPTPYSYSFSNSRPNPFPNSNNATNI